MITLSIVDDEYRQAAIDRVKEHRRALSRESAPWLIGPPVAAGVSVTPHTALSVSGYWCGINVIAADIAVLDFPLYRKTGTDDRERATGHAIDRILNEAPNGDMNPVDFWQTILAHALGWGDGYAEIEWDNAGRPLALWPILPSQIEPRVEQVEQGGRHKSRLYYVYSPSYNNLGPSVKTRLESWDVFHVGGLGFDGIRGYSVAQMARQSLGLSIATEVFGGAFFGNGALPGVALEHPGELSKGAQDRLIQSFEERHQGADAAHRPIVLEEGMKISKPITIPPEDAQFVGTRQLQIEEMARWLRIQPHKLMHKMGERPGGNLETSDLDYLTTTLLPWTTRLQQEVKRKLISKAQAPSYYAEHLYQRRLMVDTPTRMGAWKTLWDMGVVTEEYIAQKENLPKPEEKTSSLTFGEKVEAVGQLIRAGFDPAAAASASGLPPIKHTGLVPVTVKEDDPAPAATQPDPAPAAGQRQGIIDARMRAAVAERIGIYVRRESGRVSQAAKKDAGGFGAWVSEFYRREAAVLGDALAPLVALRLAHLGSGGSGAAIAERLAEAYVERSREELLSLKAKDLGFEAERLAQRWEATRAAELADRIMALAGEELKHAA